MTALRKRYYDTRKEAEEAVHQHFGTPIENLSWLNIWWLPEKRKPFFVGDPGEWVDIPIKDD